MSSNMQDLSASPASPSSLSSSSASSASVVSSQSISDVGSWMVFRDRLSFIPCQPHMFLDQVRDTIVARYHLKVSPTLIDCSRTLDGPSIPVYTRMADLMASPHDAIVIRLQSDKNAASTAPPRKRVKTDLAQQPSTDPDAYRHPGTQEYRYLNEELKTIVPQFCDYKVLAPVQAKAIDSATDALLEHMSSVKFDRTWLRQKIVRHLQRGRQKPQSNAQAASSSPAAPSASTVPSVSAPAEQQPTEPSSSSALPSSAPLAASSNPNSSSSMQVDGPSQHVPSSNSDAVASASSTVASPPLASSSSPSSSSSSPPPTTVSTTTTRLGTVSTSVPLNDVPSAQAAEYALMQSIRAAEEQATQQSETAQASKRKRTQPTSDDPKQSPEVEDADLAPVAEPTSRSGRVRKPSERRRNALAEALTSRKSKAASNRGRYRKRSSPAPSADTGSQSDSEGADSESEE